MAEVDGATRNPVEDQPPAPSSRAAPRARRKRNEPRPPGPPRQLNFLEHFIDKYFLIMPGWVRVTVYLLLVLTLVHTVLEPTTLEGQLLIKTPEGKTVRGKDYAIQSGQFQFWTNASGMWMLQTRRRLPGSIKAFLIDPEENQIGEVTLPMPLPIYSAVAGDSLVLVYDQRKGTVERMAALQLDFVATAEADQQVTAEPVREGRDRLRLGIRQLVVKDNGSQSMGKIYAKVWLDGRLLDTPKLPQKRFPNTYLAIQDNSTSTFDNLFFSIPPLGNRPSEVRIDLFEDDSGPGIFAFFGTDERIGSFTFRVGPDDLGKERWLTSGPVEAGGPGNSSLLISVDDASR